MKIKVCGMKNANNILALSQLPIDMMGIIFYKKSPRYVDTNVTLPSLEGIQKVGVFVNEEIHIIIKKIADYNLKYVQLHGDESPNYCFELVKTAAQTFGCDDELLVVKAFSVDKDFDFATTKAYEPFCEYFLFDTKGENRGGTGLQFDWSLLQKYKGDVPFFLSGGINEHSASSIRAFKHPQFYGIDINSKFEVEAGLKDIKKIEEFISLLVVGG